jgi:hypothetical protein
MVTRSRLVVRRSEALLGQPEDSVVVDFNYYRATDPASPRLDLDVWEEVEQMAFCIEPRTR